MGVRNARVNSRSARASRPTLSTMVLTPAGDGISLKRKNRHAVFGRQPSSDALPLRALPPCPMSPATMLPTAENATAADGKEVGVPFVFPPRPPPSLLSSARGARRSVPSHAAADALTCAGAARDDDDDGGDDRAR